MTGSGRDRFGLCKLRGTKEAATCVDREVLGAGIPLFAQLSVSLRCQSPSQTGVSSSRVWRQHDLGLSDICWERSGRWGERRAERDVPSSHFLQNLGSVRKDGVSLCLFWPSAFSPLWSLFIIKALHSFVTSKILLGSLALETFNLVWEELFIPHVALFWHPKL